MDHTSTDVFVERAREFCEFVPNARDLPIQERLMRLAWLLASLYAASLELPEVEPGSSPEPSVVRPEACLEFGEHDCYWEVFDPYEHGQPVCGSLADDVLDVYHDVAVGLVLYDQGAVNDAIWTWAFLRDHHWGDHAVDALRALQRARQRVGGEHTTHANDISRGRAGTKGKVNSER
jgi:hypothetical protein